MSDTQSGSGFHTDVKTQLKEEKQLNQDKKKAVLSEDRLRERIRELKKCKSRFIYYII